MWWGLWAAVAAAEPVSLRFQCVDGARATTTAEVSRSQVENDAPPVVSALLSAKGQEVRVRDGELCRVARSGTVDVGDAPPDVARVIGAVASQPLVDVVGGEGALIEIEGIDQATAALRATLEVDFANHPPQVRAALDGIVAKLLAPETLVGQGAGDWMMRASFWHAAELSSGEVYESSQQPGTPHRAIFSAAPAACPQPGFLRCADLSLRFEYDEATVRETVIPTLGGLFAAFSGLADLPDLSTLQVSKVEVHRLLVDADTLTPFTHHKEETTEMAYGGLTRKRVTTSDYTWTWTLPPEPAKKAKKAKKSKG